MLTVLLAATVAAWQLPPTPVASERDSFPHADHRRLFTTCSACHAGIETGRAAAVMPPPTQCRDCHDGTRSRVVFWTPGAVRPGNLAFEHRAHIAKVAERGDSALTCASCHRLADATAGFMAVGRATPETCLACHAHRANNHLAAETACRTCHQPLTAATRLTSAQIAAFPKPSSHDRGYTLTHGREAAASVTCQVCHARESCASCHVNATRIASITALGADRRVAALTAARPVTYPAPADHEARGFLRAHGGMARAGTTSCAACHARESCLTCHRAEERVAAVAQMPRRSPGGAPGVDLSARQPPDHVAGFASQHRMSAAGGDASCGNCHTQSYCASCHNGASSPGFHGTSFVERHASSAYTQDTECASCHQVTTFCLDCHRQTGVSSVQALPAGKFHSTVANWTLSHGGAARRSLESCASCHTQTSCLQCHSATRGWRINPHGTIAPSDLRERNAQMCRVCHTAGTPR